MANKMTPITPENPDNPGLQLAEEYVRHTDRHIFLTGKAGTGKTTFLHNVKNQTPKRLVVTAPTGVAAINAGGVTLHSFFQLPFGPFIPGGSDHIQRYRFSKEKKNIIQCLDLLVIDEISMVRADLLDGVDSVLRRYRRNSQPFGGVQLLMIGDLLQLPPVVKDEEWRILQAYYDSPYFFSSTALRQSEMVVIELQHIYRQSDQRFIDLLNRVRDNDVDPATFQQLNQRHIPNFTPRDDEDFLTLCTHNAGADRINTSKLQSLPGKSHLFEAEREGDFPQQAFPTAATLELKAGAQVMFMRNDASGEKRYFNGKIGKITKISRKAVEVRCPEDPGPIAVEKAEWENIEYTVDPKRAEISRKTVGIFRQYPLKLAWAITIHKSQGLTFDKVIIDARSAFACGQVYVALSRCRTFEGMVLSTPLSSPAIKTDQTVYRFLEENRRQAPSRASLTAAKIRYQQQLLLACFSFADIDSLLSRLTTLVTQNAGVLQVSGIGDMAKLRSQTLAEICSVSEKFKRQLQGLFTDTRPPAKDPAVLDRLTKASAFFTDKITTILTPLIDELRIETDNQEIRRKSQDTLKQLARATAVKLAAVKSCGNGFSPSRYLRALSTAAIDAGPSRPEARQPAYSEADIAHPELFQALKAWRQNKAAAQGVAHFQVLHQKTLIQIAIHLPDSLTALKRVKGIGKGLAAKYGEELVALVADYRRKHGIEKVVLPDSPSAIPASKPDTKTISLEMFSKGLTIPQIAEQRGLVTGTIESHLAFFVEQGELAIDAVVPDKKREAIEKKFADCSGDSYKELKTALGDDYSYGEIKLVLAHLKHIEQNNQP